MKSFQTFRPIPALAFAMASLVCVVGGSVKADDSIRVREMEAALALSQAQLVKEKGRADALEAQRKVLVKSLSEAVRVSEEQVVASREARLKLQAFGVDLFTRDENSIGQRLLKAVRDLDISQQENERQGEALHGLSEAFLYYLGESEGVEKVSRDKAGMAIAKAGKAISPLLAEDGAPSAIEGSKVVSQDKEIGLIVFDAGRQEGLRVGTPLAVLRGERPIFTAMVVDVRESISGAVLQDRIADVEEVAVGDGIKLLPNQTNF